METLIRRSVCAVFFLGLVACDDEDTRDRKELEAFATTALGTPDKVTEEARAAEEAKLKEVYARKKKEEEDAAAKVDATLKSIVGQPDKLPKNLDAACDEMLKAYDEYQRRTLNDDGAVLEWVDNKRKYLGERRVKCVAIGSVEAAACQTKALAEAPDDFNDRGLEILSACVDAYAADNAAALAVKAAEADRAAAGGE